MTKKPTEWENVKVRKSTVNKMRSYKKKTGVSIMAFTEIAILEKLDVLKRWERVDELPKVHKKRTS